MKAWTIHRSSLRPILGVATITAVYVYFLIFAQFAFLRMAGVRGFGPEQLREIMASMGAGGIVGSFLAAQYLTAEHIGEMLGVGFLGAAFATGISVVADRFGAFCLISALIGASVGHLTVTLAAGLPNLLGTRSIGWPVGFGTGFAYAICNLPVIFGADATVQAGVAGIGCLIGFVASFFASGPCVEKEPAESCGFLRGSFVLVILEFLALVWLDSAAFYILQNTPTLNRFGWSSTVLQWQNAGIHLGAALFAGWLIDRGKLSRLPVMAVIFLGAAGVCVSSDREAFARATHWLYAAGVSLYSVALVCAVIQSGSAGLKQSARRAAVLFSVAGWAGSALGIGMAQDLHVIPGWFIALAISVMAGTTLWRWRLWERPRLSVAALMVFTTGTGIVFHSSAGAVRSDSLAKIAPSPQLGREVYIAEGCIHCHSQYIRPGTMDEEWWGPVHSSVEILAQAPPLIGNRRQGPDLLNVGNRRSLEWNRLHLISPRALSPGSVMPSYAYLFRGDDRRGESLLAYLGELGGASIGDRFRLRAEWTPVAEDSRGADAAGRFLFARHCVPCHGQSGAGDGSLAHEFGVWRPRNLTLAEWTQIPRDATSRQERVELARTIKFGILGTPMAGHETWSDRELWAVAGYVQSLAPSQRVK